MVSEFWHRYWQRLAGARPRPEPAALKAADANAAVLEARAEITQLRTEVGQANADAASLRQEAMRLREDNRDLRDGVAKGLLAQDQDAASIAALTDRAEQAEATAASLRDDNARLGRTIERAERKLAGLLDPYQISDEEFEAAKAGVTARYGSIPPSLQKVIDMGGRFGLAAARGTEDGFFLLDRAEVEAGDARLAAMTAVLERFAAPGAMTAGERRGIAAEALASKDSPEAPAGAEDGAQGRTDGFLA